MPWHPFPFFSVSSFPFWRAREMSHLVWLSPGWDSCPLTSTFPQSCGSFVFLDISCDPESRFLGTNAAHSERAWVRELRFMTSYQLTQQLSWRQEDELRWAGKPRAARKWALSFGVGPPPASRVSYLLQKERKKERKGEADERGRKSRRKKIKEGESREGSWGRRQRGEEGDVKKSSSISSWRAYNAPSSRFYIYYLFKCLQ